MPARQFEHTVAEEAEYAPALQAAVTTDKPLAAQYDPAVHEEQLDEPAEALKYPAGQVTQLDEPADA